MVQFTEEWRKAHAGTVSHGTLRTQDLLRSFAAKLEEFERENEFVIGECIAYAAILDNDDCEANTILAQMALDEVVDCLQAHAPEGWYFGTHPGDGSDFGFWMEEE